MTNYVYLLYGPQEEVYLEAAYGIGTLLRRMDARASRVIVFTDRPDRIKGWPVICESIAGDLAAMQGPTRYIHRAKPCVILRCLERYSGNVIFFDSDTFVSGNVGALANQLRAGIALMDSFESRNPMPELAGFSAALSVPADYHYSEKSVMYNSGVTGLHRDDRRLVEGALELCDALLAAGSPRHTVEQFAISEMLRMAGARVVESRGAVVHYVKAKLYVREQILKRMRATGKQPWEFERAIPYWYPAVKFMKLFGKYTA